MHSRDNLLFSLRLTVTIGMALAALPVAATDLGRTTQIHGFGGWAVGNSDSYPFLSGEGEGENEFDNVDFALHVSSQPTDKLTLFAQVLFESDDDGETSEVELAVAEWAFSDELHLRLGRSRLPFGIYTETFDIGTLRPFFHLPQSIYGPTGFVSEAYNGIGLTGTAELSSDWGLAWDVFGGGMSLDISEPFEEAFEAIEEDDEADGDSLEEEEEGEGDIENALGGRLVFETPISGLSFGVSAYAGEPESAGDLFEEDGEDDEDGDDEEIETSWGDFQSIGFHVEYISGAMSLRAEAGRHEESEFDTDSFYVELGYHLTEEWQLAARFESIDVEFEEELPSGLESLLQHDEWAAGINYWFSPSMVVKLSYHQIDGNLFAFPEGEEFQEAVEEFEFDESTRLINFGVQFSF